MKHDKASFDVLGKIEKERLKRNWTEYTLAKNSGLTQSTISTWYRKDLQPSVASIEKICIGLGITLGEFFSNDIKDNCETSERNKIVDMYEKLSPEQRGSLFSLLKSFTD